MLEALCLAVGIFCHDGDRPPAVAPPATKEVRISAPTMKVPRLKAPTVRPAQFFDPTCEVQPPHALKHHYWAAARRHPGGATDCELAKQGKAECDICWATGDYTIKSPAGAIGVAQLLPKTAQELDVDPRNPGASINAQARYMRWQTRRWTPGLDGRVRDDIMGLAWSGYNWGLGNLRRDQERNGWVLFRDAYPHLPKETRDYYVHIVGQEP